MLLIHLFIFYQVWTLTTNRLRGMKSADKLQDIDREAGMAIFYNIAKKPTHHSASTLLYIHPDSSFSFHRKRAYIIRYIYKIINNNKSKYNICIFTRTSF